MRALLTSLLLLAPWLVSAQTDTVRSAFYQTRFGPYNPSRTLACDLLHTDLDLRFDWTKQQAAGTATLWFKPWFYPQDSVAIDAKGFLISSVALIDTNRAKPTTTPLSYAYTDGRVLRVKLPRTYTRTESFAIRITYTARPNELPKTERGPTERSSTAGATSDDKGLYFINPDGKQPGVPRQIWTQGETEANSCWFPTVDTPNEKMTQDFRLTVESRYRTLSNGQLVSQTRNPDGTRTDRWVQTLPHAPYLAMVGVGDFAYVRDSLPPTADRKGLEVSYYVEPAYEKNARGIFGRTPAMIRFFEQVFGVPYVWHKYSQMVVRDFVSGAMENTTATVHNEAVQMDARQLVDENSDAVIAHELAHHWFGDLVTCESWANLPLNEAFATYAEYLWFEHAKGPDEAELQRQSDLFQYLSEAETKQEPLIRYRHADREDMFDAHSYQKGGLVLHLLRKVVGDEAFFASLKRYLNTHRFGTAEVANLREAFEAVTGQDLNWFFEQWFLAPGHAVVRVEQQYTPGRLTLQVRQRQDSLGIPGFVSAYRVPVLIDVWVKGKRTRYDVWLNQADQTVTLPVAEQPELVLFDADYRLVGTVEHTRSRAESLFQYTHADTFRARVESLTRLLEPGALTHPDVVQTLIKALDDPFWKIRQMAVSGLANYTGDAVSVVDNRLRQLAGRDPKSAVRAEALATLSTLRNPANSVVFKQALTDSSYTVVSVALVSYLKGKPADADAIVAQFANERNGSVLAAVADYYAEAADPRRYDWFTQSIGKIRPTERYEFLLAFGKYLLLSSQAIQKKALPTLEAIARNDASPYARFGAYQALGLLLDLPGVSQLRAAIRTAEKDAQLRAIYKQMGE
ncbi:peptidase M1 [Rudanella paleaurantiibacter]|uniref:Aminopeptidase N n=1 Tax=Rudanella paleaurantiibacter TaxID=2614655 RepID=A0A7J5TVX7_9BACT|nr:M1 family aminopeptidase [Rudanella paleaurantiibacter]KAB7728382.1 peptidase M1 [Rudanella paleaurantiibacter]